jgi:hypothetical protein
MKVPVAGSMMMSCRSWASSMPIAMPTRPSRFAAWSVSSMPSMRVSVW